MTCSLAWYGVLALSASVVFEGKSGPGVGKRIVLISGDEEYRSEEALPQLGRILSVRHGFSSTVLFAIDPRDGTVDPEVRNNIPGLEALASADLMILFTRFRDLPDNQMEHIAQYVGAGKPIVALRTATHAFAPKAGKYESWHWRAPGGGFGRRYLGETWVAHHGAHGKQSTRARLAPGKETHPILRGITDGEIWGPTDVYSARPTPDCEVILLGEVVAGMDERDPPVAGEKNEPMMPVAWTRWYLAESGQQGRVFATTMGSSQDLRNEAFRRLLVNASYWALGMEDRIGEKADVGLVGEYAPTPFGFKGHQRGRRPEEF